MATDCSHTPHIPICVCSHAGGDLHLIGHGQLLWSPGSPLSFFLAGGPRTVRDWMAMHVTFQSVPSSMTVTSRCQASERSWATSKKFIFDAWASRKFRDGRSFPKKWRLVLCNKNGQNGTATSARVQRNRVRRTPSSSNSDARTAAGKIFAMKQSTFPCFYFHTNGMTVPPNFF